MWHNTGFTTIDNILGQPGWERPRTKVALDQFTSELVDKTVAIRNVPKTSTTAPAYLWRIESESKKGIARHEFVRSAVLYYLLSMVDFYGYGSGEVPTIVEEFSELLGDKEFLLHQNTPCNFYKNLSK